MKRVAVLDLGSNSFHGLVADVTDTGLVEPYVRERTMLHLGAVVERFGHLPDDVADQAVATVAHLAELARRSNCEALGAVATSALRDAANGPAVLARFAKVLGQPVRLLTGDEEADLAFRGAHAVLALPGTTWLVLDLGGGSLEIAVGGPDGVTWSTSLDLGVSRLSTMVTDLDAPLEPADAAALRQRIVSALSPHVAALREMQIDEVVAAGGTVRAIGAVLAAARMSWLPLSVNQLAVRTDEVRELADRLGGLATPERERVNGMNERRADRLPIAAMILATVADELAFERMTISDGGVREGVLLDLAGVAPPTDPTTMRRLAVAYVHASWLPDDAHSDHVEHLAGRLFDETRSLHGLDQHDRELLVHAGRLHDIGQSVALKGHHRHGAYLIENATLPGFEPQEVAQLATLTRFHRDGPPVDGYEPWDSLQGDIRDRTVGMLALLQLADSLDRARDQHVADLSIVVRGTTVHVGLDGDHLRIAREDIAVKGRLFSDTFGVSLELEGDLEDPAA